MIEWMNEWKKRKGSLYLEIMNIYIYIFKVLTKEFVLLFVEFLQLFVLHLQLHLRNNLSTQYFQSVALGGSEVPHFIV